MRKEYITFRKNDKEVIENLKIILNDLGLTSLMVNIKIGESQYSVSSSIAINTIIDHDKSLYSYFQIDFSYMNMTSNLILEREKYFIFPENEKLFEYTGGIIK